jgi:hypothetical protein
MQIPLNKIVIFYVHIVHHFSVLLYKYINMFHKTRKYLDIKTLLAYYVKLAIFVIIIH